MLEYIIALILTLLVGYIVVYSLLKGINVNFNINVIQQFSEQDRALLEDLYNSDGDPKSDDRGESSIDNLLSQVNDIMLGVTEEDEING